MTRLALLGILAVASAAAATAATPSSPVSPSTPVSSVQRSAAPKSIGRAAAVRAADQPLVFTGVVCAATAAGEPRQQAEGALAALERTLATAGSSLAQTVRLNAYVATDAAVAIVEKLIAERFAATPVAVTVIRTPLAQPGAAVGFEAVATSAKTDAKVTVVADGAALLPPGNKIFISGQAEKGTDVATAVRATMAGLHRSLGHLGLKKTDVVQVKAFVKPFSDHGAARREIAASFDAPFVPAIVLIEWVSDLYAEIELVASASAMRAQPDQPITYDWFPWLTKSPRYCNVTFVSAGTPLIFIGAVDGGDANDPRTQMKTIFERLGSVLFDAGSSYRNLAKATYYLADPTARTLLGDIRGVYFDPTRPPAASALNMTSLGYPGRAAMIDMIAVPVK